MISFLSSSALVLGNRNDDTLVQGFNYTITGVYTYLVVAYRGLLSSGNYIVKRLLDKITGFVLISFCIYVSVPLICFTNMTVIQCTIPIHTCIVVLLVCNISSDLVTKSALARNCIHPHYPEAELSTVTIVYHYVGIYCHDMYVSTSIYILLVYYVYITITQPLLTHYR